MKLQEQQPIRQHLLLKKEEMEQQQCLIRQTKQ